MSANLGKIVRSFTTPTTNCDRLATAGNGRFLIAETNTEEIYLVNSNGVLINSFTCVGHQSGGMFMLEDGNIVVVDQLAGTLHVYKGMSGVLLESVTLGSAARGICTDGRYYLGITNDFFVFNLDGTIVRQDNTFGAMQDLWFFKKYVYVVDGSTNVRIWDYSHDMSVVNTGEQIVAISGTTALRGICSDTNYLYVLDNDGGDTIYQLMM